MRSQLIDILKSVAVEEKLITSYTSTIPTDKKTQLLEAINDVKQEVAERCDLSALLQEFYMETADYYTTGTIAVNKGSVSMTITTGAFTAAMVGRRMQISGDSTIYTIASRTSAAVAELNRPFMGTSVTAATFTIFADEYDLGQEIAKVQALMPQDARDLVFRKLHPKELVRRYPNPVRNLTDPVFYCDSGSRQNVETLTVSSATTTTVTATGFTGTHNNYYNGWLLRNKTRGKMSRITAFVYSTGVITIDEAIAGQAAADTIEVIQSTGRVMMRNVPTAAIYIRGYGFRPPTRFINDYDVDYEIPEDFSDRVLKAGLRWQVRITDPNHQEITQADIQLKKEYDDLIGQIEDFEEVKEYADKKYQFGGGAQVADNPFVGSGWPADQG